MRLSGRLFFDMLDIRLSGFQLLLVIFFPLFRIFFLLSKNRLGFFELTGVFGFLRGVLFKIFFQLGNFAQKRRVHAFRLTKKFLREKRRVALRRIIRSPDADKIVGVPMIQIPFAGNIDCVCIVFIVEQFKHVFRQRRFCAVFRRKRAFLNRQIDKAVQGICQIVAHPLTEIFFGQLLEIEIGILFLVERVARFARLIIIGIIRAGKDDVSAGLEHAPDLLNEQFGVIEMLDRLKRADHIEGMIFKGKLLRGVALVMHAVAAEEPRRGFHGLLVHVDALHRFRTPAAQQKAAVSFAAGHVQHALARDVRARHRVTVQMDGRFHRAVFFLPAEIQPFNHFAHKLFLSVRRAPARIRYVSELNFMQCAINS